MKLNSRNIFSFALLVFILAMLSGSGISVHATTSHTTKDQHLKESITSTNDSVIGLSTIQGLDNEFNDLLDGNDGKTVFLHGSLQDLPIFSVRLASSVTLSLPDNSSYLEYLNPYYILFHNIRIPSYSI